ncbi:MAG TPA: hypothetical protein VF693_08665 [Allosphingosinicella sp.]
MEQNRNQLTPETATDKPASPINAGDGYFSPPPPGHPAPPREKVTVPSGPPLLSDSLETALDDAIDETFPPGSARPRRDGFTPERIAGFLRHLAATGIVEHAARVVGLSATAAYNFRNARRGRAFAKMWDAVLIHRSRARVASELQGRSIAGCVSIRKRDGVVVGEYHYYDNRLGMALLTRLDKLADKEAANEAQLRALSEDLDDYIDCVAAGGDADAFVAARRPADPPLPDVVEAAKRITALARGGDSNDDDEKELSSIAVHDLDPTRKAEWTTDQWARAFRSGFVAWLTRVEAEPGWTGGPGAHLRFIAERDAERGAALGFDRPPLGASTRADAADMEVADLDPQDICNWSYQQLIHAWRSGLLRRLPARFWDDLAARDASEAGWEPGE